MHAESQFPPFFGVVIFKMDKFQGQRARKWLDLNKSQIREIFDIVSLLHEVNSGKK
jgi:hypothetical protein